MFPAGNNVVFERPQPSGSAAKKVKMHPTYHFTDEVKNFRADPFATSKGFQTHAWIFRPCFMWRGKKGGEKWLSTCAAHEKYK
jgi:hypothetical protein